MKIESRQKPDITSLMPLNAAFQEISKSSSGGAPFLLSYGVTFLVVAALSFFLSREVSALLVMFQGVVALPAAFWLERFLRRGRMSPANPLRKLSVYLALSQALVLPLLVIVYSVNPGLVPVCMAGLAAVHLLPYAWLHRSRVYVFLAVALSLGSFLLVLVFGSASYELVLFLVAAAYLTCAPLLYRGSRGAETRLSARPLTFGRSTSP